VTEPENCWKGWGTVNLYASTSTSRTEPPSGSPRSLPVQLTGRVIGVAVASVLPASAPVPQSFCGGRGTTVITADMLPVARGGVGKTVSSAVLVTPPRDAEIVTGVGAVTAATVTLKPKVVFAFGPTNVILAGTVATPGLLLEKLTTIGVAGSGPLNVIPPAMT